MRAACRLWPHWCTKGDASPGCPARNAFWRSSQPPASLHYTTGPDHLDNLQEGALQALDALMYQMEIAAEAARAKLATLGPSCRICSVWLLRLADALQVHRLCFDDSESASSGCFCERTPAGLLSSAIVADTNERLSIASASRQCGCLQELDSCLHKQASRLRVHMQCLSLHDCACRACSPAVQLVRRPDEGHSWHRNTSRLLPGC